jgi:hypothetical protein
MYDVLNVQTVDAEAMAEIEMTSNLIIAASTSNERLTQDAINRALGIARCPDTVPEQTAGRSAGAVRLTPPG